MIEIRDVVKTFDGFRALDGVTMTVPRGAVYGLVGPNGAGKSTLIRHLTGIYRPDSGTIDIDGQPVYENPAVKARSASGGCSESSFDDHASTHLQVQRMAEVRAVAPEHTGLVGDEGH